MLWSADTCVKCGEILDYDAKFCGECGAAVAAHGASSKVDAEASELVNSAPDQYVATTRQSEEEVAPVPPTRMSASVAVVAEPDHRRVAQPTASCVACDGADVDGIVQQQGVETSDKNTEMAVTDMAPTPNVDFSIEAQRSMSKGLEGTQAEATEASDPGNQGSTTESMDTSAPQLEAADTTAREDSGEELSIPESPAAKAETSELEEQDDEASTTVSTQSQISGSTEQEHDSAISDLSNVSNDTAEELSVRESEKQPEASHEEVADDISQPNTLVDEIQEQKPEATMEPDEPAAQAVDETITIAAEHQEEDANTEVDEEETVPMTQSTSVVSATIDASATEVETQSAEDAAFAQAALEFEHVQAEAARRVQARAAGIPFEPESPPQVVATAAPATEGVDDEENAPETQTNSEADIRQEAERLIQEAKAKLRAARQQSFSSAEDHAEEVVSDSGLAPIESRPVAHSFSSPSSLRFARSSDTDA